MILMRWLKFIPQVISSRLNLVAMTVSNAFSDLVAFFVIALFILMGFTALFHFTLGMYFREFSSIAQTMYMVTLGLSAVWNPTEWYEEDPVTAVVLLLTFTLLSTWLLATIIIAIVTESFVEAKREVHQRLFQSEMKKHRKQVMLLAWVNADPFAAADSSRSASGGDQDASSKNMRVRTALALRKSVKLFTPRRVQDCTGGGGNTSCSASDETELCSAASDGGRSGKSSGKSTGLRNTSDDSSTGPPSPRGITFCDSLVSSPASAPKSGKTCIDSKAPLMQLNRIFSRGMLSGGLEKANSCKLLTPREAVDGDEAGQRTPRALIKRASFGIPQLTQIRSASSPPQKREYLLKVALWEAVNVVSSNQICNPNVKLHIERPARLDLEQGMEMYHSGQRSKTVQNSRKEMGGRDREGSKPIFEWNEGFTLHLPSDPDPCLLVISLYDQDRFSTEKLLGFSVLPIALLLTEGEPRQTESWVLQLRQPNSEAARTPSVGRLGSPIMFGNGSKESEDEENAPTLFVSLKIHRKIPKQVLPGGVGASGGLFRMCSAGEPSAGKGRTRLSAAQSSFQSTLPGTPESRLSPTTCSHESDGEGAAPDGEQGAVKVSFDDSLQADGSYASLDQAMGSVEEGRPSPVEGEKAAQLPKAGVTFVEAVVGGKSSRVGGKSDDVMTTSQKLVTSGL